LIVGEKKNIISQFRNCVWVFVDCHHHLYYLCYLWEGTLL